MILSAYRDIGQPFPAQENNNADITRIADELETAISSILRVAENTGQAQISL